MHTFHALVPCIALTVVASAARADHVVVPYDFTGGFQADGKYSNAKPGNYRVGRSPITTDPERRNFFTFDLTAFGDAPPGTVTAATLRLYMPKFAPDAGSLDPGDGYISPDPFEIFTLTTSPYSADDLTDAAITPIEAIDIFATLGTGLLAGEVALSPADKGTMVSIPLTADATSGINALLGHGELVLGGRLSSLSFIPPDELAFGFTDLGAPHMAGKAPELVLTFVPAPGTVVSCLPLLMVWRRRGRSRMTRYARS